MMPADSRSRCRLRRLEPSVALVHDYVTQRGGAERVVLTLARAFPGAPLSTSLYAPATTFPEFADIDVQPGPLSSIPLFRRDHRLALPLLAPFFSATRIDADVTLVSSSGWAHGVRATGRKIVYCHTPARWLYQADLYLRGRGPAARLAAGALRAPLVRWDRAAARTADRYVANSTAVAARIAETYGIDAEVVPPPPALTPDGATMPVADVEPGFVLCVSRLLPYKNVDVVAEAFGRLPDERLIVAGSGPDERALRGLAPANVTFLGRVSDEQLRWLYAHADVLVAASYEDFGLTPLEAAGFGKPAAALRWGGFLDTVREGRTGVFFDTPTIGAIAAALRDARRHSWRAETIREHAERYAEGNFIARMRAIVREVA
jgi:glycosyltransferase involved in cell wall biosynthesis